MNVRRGAQRAVLAAVTAAAVGGCGAGHDAAASTGGSGTHAVAISVVRRAGSTLALTSVTINGARYQFVVDTGASRTLIDRATATKLRLASAGPPVVEKGVACTSSAQPVRITGWRLGGVALPDAVILGGTTPAGPLHIDGLLGSDVLSRFGRVSLDYNAHTLTLGS